MTNKEKLTNALVDLVKIKSVTGNQAEIKKVFDYIANLFPKDVFAVEYIEHENVLSQIIYFKGQNWRQAKFVLNGHIDVVQAEDAEFVPRIEGNKIYGRGTADMKSGAVAMVFALLRLVEQGKKPDCALILNSDEEIGGTNGVGYLVEKENLRPEFVLVADGSRQDQMTITHREKGIAWLEIFAIGKASHAARPWLGKNAIEILMEALQKIRDYVGGGTDAWVSSVTISKIETSNSAYNCVPADARAVVDLRFTDDFAGTPEEVVKKLQQIMPDGVNVKKITGGSILNTDKNNPYLQKLHKIMNKVCDREVVFGFGHGASDARYFSSVGIPTALIGVFGGNWHGKGEWADLDTLVFVEEGIFEFLQEVDA